MADNGEGERSMRAVSSRVVGTGACRVGGADICMGAGGSSLRICFRDIE